MQEEALVSALAASVTLTLSIISDFGKDTTTHTCSIAADASETRVTRMFEDSRVALADALQFQIGDGSAAANAWTLDMVQAPLIDEGDAA